MGTTSAVYRGDCIEWMEAYDGAPIKLIVTDPPYTLPSWSGGGFMDESKRDWINEMDVDNLSRGYSIERFAELAERVQGGKINAYFFCNKLQIPDYFRAYVEQRKCKFDILMWHKTNAMPTFHGKYLTDTEYILYFRNGGGCNPKTYDDAKTFWLADINQADKKKWKHPTIKPLSIVRTLIRNSSEPGELVADPFLGSGTTRVAAHIEGRSFLGCEMDERWYGVQEERYQKECHGVEAINGHTITQQTLF